MPALGTAASCEYSARKMEQHFFLQLLLCSRTLIWEIQAICRHLNGSITPFSPFLWWCLGLGALVVNGKKLLVASSDKKAPFME